MNTFDKHAAVIRSGTVTEGNIRALTRITRAADFRRQGYDYGRGGLQWNDVMELWSLVRQVTPGITPAQTAKGLAWLRDRRQYNKLDAAQQRIVDDFAAFTFVGWANAHPDARIVSPVPLYRVTATDGRSFAYHYGSWQAGAKFTVLP